MSGTPERASKLGGLFGCAGHEFARGDPLGVLLVADFVVRISNGFVVSFVDPVEMLLL